MKQYCKDVQNIRERLKINVHSNVAVSSSSTLCKNESAVQFCKYWTCFDVQCFFEKCFDVQCFSCKMFCCAMFFLANCARVVIPNAITGDRRFCCKNLTKHENSTPRLNLIFAIQVLQFHLFVQPTDSCWISEYLDHFQNQHSWAPKPKPDKPAKSIYLKLK